MEPREQQHPDYLVVGKITRPHGVHGAVRVKPLTDDPHRFQELQVVHAGDEEHPQTPLHIDSAQIANQFIILRFQEIQSRDDAEGLRNTWLYIPRREQKTLPDGAFYYYELIGMTAKAQDDRIIGTVVDYRNYPANDVFVVERDGEEILIPDVPEFVTEIDADNGIVRINAMEGLFE